MTPAATGRPAYPPATLLKIYLYGYLNHVQSSRRPKREAQRNIELMWLVGRLAPATAIRRGHVEIVLWSRIVGANGQALDGVV